MSFPNFEFEFIHNFKYFQLVLLLSGILTLLTLSVIKFLT